MCGSSLKYVAVLSSLNLSKSLLYTLFNNAPKYNIILNEDLFKNYIQGNNDTYVKNKLLPNIDITTSKLSKLKDDSFYKNIDDIKILMI